MVAQIFKEEEVGACVKLCALDKTPSYVGYPIGFFHFCWDVIKEDAMQTSSNLRTHTNTLRRATMHLM